jgi:hypothetical protein
MAAAVIAGSAAACLAADVVVLKSGTMMEGDVVSLTGKELVLRIESGKSILDRADVRSIHFDTTVAELTAPTKSPDTAPDKKATPNENDRPVFSPGDKKEFALGDAVRVGSLRLRLADVSIRKVRVIDLLGGVNESRDDFLVLRFEAANVGSGRDLVASGDPVFGEALVRVEGSSGARIKGKSFGAGSRVEGELRDGEKITAGNEAEDLEVFEFPGEKVEEIVVRVNLERFGEKGTLVWRGEIGR